MANSRLPDAERTAFDYRLLAIGYAPKALAAKVGLAPTPCGLTGRRATLTPLGNGAAGRIRTCIVPLRRRMPDMFDHGSKRNWSEWQDFHRRPPGPRPGALKTELHSEKIRMADPKGLAP